MIANAPLAGLQASSSDALALRSQGLTQTEAKRRLAQYGPNEPSTAKRAAPLWQLLTLFANPLAIILSAAGILSIALGEFINASIIVTMVLLSVALNFIQTYRSQKPSTAFATKLLPLQMSCEIVSGLRFNGAR